MFLHWIRWFNIVQANQHAKSSIQAFQHKSYLLSSTSTESTLDPLPLVIISMLFYMYRLDKEVIICDGNLHVNLFYYNKTPYITCTFFFLQNSSTMSILDPFFLLHIVSTIFASDPSRHSSTPSFRMLLWLIF